MTGVIVNGGNPLKDCPRSWNEARAWMEGANKDKDCGIIEPNWEFDCGFKLDFDGPLVRVSSRFYPPKGHYGDKWDGDLTLLIGDVEIKRLEFECSSLSELREKVECAASDIRDKITALLKTI